MRDVTLCWYCEKKKIKNDNSLFCSKCENIKQKEVIRTAFENAQRKEFGNGAKGLGL